MAYQKDRNRVREVLLNSGIVVVMNKKHVKKPEDLVKTMWEVYQAGYVAEATFRIDAGILKEAMKELVRMQEEVPDDKPFVLGCGSIINPGELDQAIEMGFDMIVAPGNVMGGYGDGMEFIKIAQDENIFTAPAILTPNELQYFIERPDGLEPDAIKVFPAGVHGPSGIKTLLAPFVRERHEGRIIMPTGGVNIETGPKFQEAIQSAGYLPVLGMSAPLKYVEDRSMPGDVDIIKKSLELFKEKF
ncbi:MAG: bifunctional 4-hydroxy-2-oxoglutarate aldolase/2-dehydro-3-deoxy-phosphogluconate aldolase [Bacteroidales bacterium]|nr:bifunctional 4-hydroxy-2-oxoglutarate aldolase/2-dehydro-3-deoxy-phosphogluconate aldolase [Bacteroidales bacterium]